jgi:hypothetical protein
MIIERMAGTATTLQFPLVAWSLTSLYNSCTTSMFAAGDIKISIDGADYTNTATLPASCPGGFDVVLSLTAAEITGRRMSIRIVDQTNPKVWEDQYLLIETYGTTSAMHAFNRNQTTVSASLTAAQTGVTIAAVTDITNGVNLTSTAILNNLGASATTQIQSAASAALAAASVTAGPMNRILTHLDATVSSRSTFDPAATAVTTTIAIPTAAQNAAALLGSTVTSSAFNVDTAGRRLAFLDRAISSVTAAINASDVATAVWGATQSAYDVAGTFGGHLDATVSGISVSGTGDWTDGERAQIRHALGVTGSTTAGAGGVIHSISSLLTARLDATVSSRSTFDPATSGVNLTSTAVLNNLGASATTQIQSAASAALAAASVTANPMNRIMTHLDATVSSRSVFDPATTAVTTSVAIPSPTDVANAVFAATLTSSSFNPDTGGYRMSLIDTAVSAVDDALVSIVSPWRGNVNAGGTTTAVTLGTFGDTPSTVDDFYNGNLIHIQTNVTPRARTYRIVDYNGTTKDVTLDRALEGSMIHGNGYITRDGGESIATEKTGYALSSDGNNAAADALLDRTDGIETTWTLRKTTRVMFAVLAGKLSGAATTAVAIRDVADTKDRVTATVDSNGNRTAVTLDGA